ncbi:hypothetical protein [Propionimicrobium lymphophilum]|uniref:hypothetical protein n=1 Tax=Propionimicrobium lymphophilum TaxID=33012 RepID=UPI00138AE448|nr:hypothetical protein [Propionimicrobium lymphophilum]
MDPSFSGCSLRKWPISLISVDGNFYFSVISYQQSTVACPFILNLFKETKVNPMSRRAALASAVSVTAALTLVAQSAPTALAVESMQNTSNTLAMASNDAVENAQAARDQQSAKVAQLEQKVAQAEQSYEEAKQAEKDAQDALEAKKKSCY